MLDLGETRRDGQICPNLGAAVLAGIAIPAATHGLILGQIGTGRAGLNEGEPL